MTTNQQNRSRLVRISSLTTLAMIVLMGCSQRTLAQWANQPNNNISNTNTGNVGIGTTAPNRKLELFGDVAGLSFEAFTGSPNSGAIRFGDNSGWKFHFGRSRNSIGGALNSGTAGALMTIQDNGNVGIGTTSPDVTLQVHHSSSNTNTANIQLPDLSFAFRNTSNTNGNMSLISFQDAAGFGTAQIGAIQGDQVNHRGNLVFFTRDGAGFGERMRIRSNGNIGIGTTTAANAKLHVFQGSAGVSEYVLGGAPELTLESTGITDLHFLSPDTGSGRIWFGSPSSNITGGIIYQHSSTPANGFLSFIAGNNTERIRVQGNGNVGIGTLAPNFKLDVNGEINATGLRINGTPISSGGSSQWTTAGTNIHYNSGNVGIGTTSPGSKFDVAGTIRGGNANTNIGNHATYGAVYAAFWKQGADYSVLTDGTSTLLNAPIASGTLYFRSANADKMVLQGSTGNLGIGTTAPTEKLHVNGNGRITGNLTVDGTVHAKYQDMAEWVPASHAMPAGTVVVLDPTRSNQVKASTESYDSRVAGVISVQPGLALGEAGEGRVLVATTGRVKVMVDASNGPIAIGDLLVTSDIQGVAMKSKPLNFGGAALHRPGTLIGKALEPLPRGRGEILVLLSLQ